MKRTFIITGGNSGLGYQCTKNIAMENADNHVVIASRNLEKSQKAVAALALETGNSQIHALPLNLASLASVRNFCKTVEKSNLPPLYGLVCNAISGSSGKTEYTEDGFELTFGTGHLGHFLLANLLLNTMQPNGRIIFVSSDQHNPPKWLLKMTYPDVLELAFPPKSSHAMQYSATKLSNIYCAYEMSERLSRDAARHVSTNITVNAFNPAFMANTGLGGGAKTAGEKIAKRLAPLLARLMGLHSSAEKSGKLLAAMMTDAQFEGITGKYFDRGKEIPSSKLSYNKANAVNLWEKSVELTQLKSSEIILKNTI